jgi:hypothetical protein
MEAQYLSEREFELKKQQEIEKIQMEMRENMNKLGAI